MFNYLFKNYNICIKVIMCIMCYVSLYRDNKMSVISMNIILCYKYIYIRKCPSNISGRPLLARPTCPMHTLIGILYTYI